MDDWIIILISSIVSGLLGILVTIWYYQRNEIRKTKIKVLLQFIGNRYNLRGDLFTEALNQVFIAFNDSKDVLTAMKAFHEIVITSQKTNELANMKMLDLIKAMCNNLKISIDPLTDDFFLVVFNPKI